MQLVRFALVGSLVAMIYFGFYLALLTLGLPRAGANAIAFGCAVGLQYAAQARFTFGKRLSDREQIIRFGVMIALGFVTASLITSGLGPWLLLPDWISATAVVVVLPVQNYVLMTLWVFNRHPSADLPS